MEKFQQNLNPQIIREYSEYFFVDHSGQFFSYLQKLRVILSEMN